MSNVTGTTRMTVAQALVRFLDNQYVERDGERHKFVHGVFSIFGHGNVVGLGEALVEMKHNLVLYQGHSEQGMAHAATAFAKQRDRLAICVATSSIGPGAMNMVTAAGTATVNRIPVLLLPGDAFAVRQPDPVLQQIEHAGNPNTTANDAFKAVSVYWDRVSRPEQLATAVINAMRALTDPAETGAVTICLPQDVQAEAYDFPNELLAERTWHTDRARPAPEAVERAAALVRNARKPLVIAGGGVRYSQAGDELVSFCTAAGVPVAETQAGKGTIPWDFELNLGGIGVTGNLAANRIAAEADLIIAAGTRLGDFTTASKSAFRNPEAKILTLNVNTFDAHKMDAQPLQADVREGLAALGNALGLKQTAPGTGSRPVPGAGGYHADWGSAVKDARDAWNKEADRLYASPPEEGFLSQMGVLGLLNEELLAPDAIVVGSSGSLPGDLQRLWRTRARGAYHMEYGFSCMGYEISGALGVKIAEPDREVYALAGDGSYLMLHSELVSAIREGIKINVVVFDNLGFQCIDNLQTSKGISSYATYFRTRDKAGKLNGPTLAIDFAANARAYGAQAWTVKNADELRDALAESKKSSVSCVIDIKVAPKSMTGGYDAWWRVGVPEVSSNPEVVKAYRENTKMVERARQY